MFYCTTINLIPKVMQLVSVIYEKVCAMALYKLFIPEDGDRVTSHRVRVTLWLVVYCQSVHLGAEPHSQSQLLYDWWFTANQFVLESNPLRVTTSNFFFFSWTLAVIVLMSCTVILESRVPRTHDQILLSQFWDSPNLEGQVPIFISPRNRMAQLYHQALGSLFIASYNSSHFPKCHVSLYTHNSVHRNFQNCLVFYILSGDLVPAETETLTHSHPSEKYMWVLYECTKKHKFAHLHIQKEALQTSNFSNKMSGLPVCHISFLQNVWLVILQVSTVCYVYVQIKVL
jgi:hypothetical protein